jgi:exonuclease-1
MYRYVDFAMHRVRMLIHFGVTPYLVFDGDNLPSKAGTEADRAKRREESRRRGLELYKAGKISQAQQELQKAVDVTPFMARQLIEELKRWNIQYIVAPYEADAQLAYLEAKGIINGILSEDSDLLVFGAKRLLTKLDQHGDCVEINRADFASCREISLVGWSDAEFRRMAILSGCDYLPSINKMGLKTAYRYVRKYKNAEKVLRMLQFEGQLTVPAGYLEKYQQAELTFLHHRVFCPIAKKIVFLTQLEPGTKEEDLPYIGEDVDPEIAVGVACGDLDPMSKALMSVRAAAASSSRSALVGPRRQTLATSVDLKPKKSLNSFFKPKRQPLAELDPNSLTPSPSQQRLLAANANASWEARTTSSAPQLGRSISSMSQPGGQSRDSSRITDRATFLARASTISTYQPPKRQRLCSDAEEPLATGGISKSRFFDSNTEEPSPSVRKKCTSKKARKSDFGIFSDDSVDDILLELADIGVPIKYPNLDNLDHESAVDTDVAEDHSFYYDSGFFDDTQAVPESSPMRSSEAKSQPSISGEMSLASTNKETRSSISNSAATTLISAEADPEAFEDLLEYHVRKQNEALLKTFIGQSPSRRASALSKLKRDSMNGSSTSQSEPFATRVLSQDSQPHNAEKTGMDEVEVQSDTEAHEKLRKTFTYQQLSQQAAALKSLSQSQDCTQERNPGPSTLGLGVSQRKLRGNMTPLQRLGQQALRKTRPHLGADTSAPQQQILVVEGDEPVERVVHSMAHGTTSSSTLKGSEDLVVPNSEDENESDGAEEPVGGIKVQLDLAKFVFTPKYFF